jgi:hypothetical protein
LVGRPRVLGGEPAQMAVVIRAAATESVTRPI